MAELGSMINKEKMFNYAPPVDRSGEGGPESNPALDYYRRATAEGSTYTEVLMTRTEKPPLVFAGREIARLSEATAIIPTGEQSIYVTENTLAALAQRAGALELGSRELLDLGIIGSNGKGGFEEKVPGFGYKRTYTENGFSDEIGSDAERSELVTTLNNIRAEIRTRGELAKMFQVVWAHTENLEGLTNLYYEYSPTQKAMDQLFKAEGLKNINGESFLNKTDGGVEFTKGHEFGDAISASSMCLEIAAASESPQKLEALLKRPGTRLLFSATDAEVDALFIPDVVGAPPRPRNESLEKWIGKPWKPVRGGKEDLKEDLKEKASSRGLLTKYGNILTETEWSNIAEVRQNIERFIGGGPNTRVLVRNEASAAENIAWELIRITAEASDIGGEIYKDNKGNIVKLSHDLGGMTSCDRVKPILIDWFREIYAKYKGDSASDFGPEGSLGLGTYNKLAVPYWKSWAAETPNGKRTFQEMKWGYRAGTVKDIVTGEEVPLPEEKAYKLGELPWMDLSPKMYNSAALGIYISGRKDIGLFQYAMNTSWQLDELKDKDFWYKISKHMRISFTPQVVLDGSFRGVFNGNDDHDSLAKTKVSGLVRDYKRKYITSFWNGLRSLPQWREWIAKGADILDENKKSAKSPFLRSLYRLKKTRLFSQEEIDGFDKSSFLKDEFS